VLAPTLILYIAAGEASTPEAIAMLRAVEQVIGTSIAVQVQSPSPVPDDAAMEHNADTTAATAVARIQWLDGERTRAAIHALLLTTSESLDRTVSFRPGDSPQERGRTLGFIVGSFVVLSLHLADRPPSPDLRAATDSGPARPPRFTLEAFVLGGVALGGEGDGLGGGIGVRWPAQHVWGLRLGARARVGSVSQAASSLLAAGFYAGVIRALLPGAGLRPGLAVRLDAVLFYEALTHFSDDDPQPVRLGHFVPGTAAALDLEWSIAPTAAAYLAGGAEAVFGRTAVLVHQNRVAEVAPVRLLVEVGFRARF
jgi:hypothetical protein